ncbi:polysaccharide biosynthesis protein [Alphaproteobacteria bacterium]|nr:polysaccharide biosynthesis protein [Alphaproteobacteria bacterium]
MRQFEGLNKLLSYFDRSLAEIRLPIKRILLIFFDCLAITLSLIMAMLLRLETLSFLDKPDIYIAVPVALTVTLVVFAVAGLYRAFLRHISVELAMTVAFGSLAAMLSLYGIKYGLNLSIPRSVPLIFATLIFISISGSRFTLRSLLMSRRSKSRRQIAVYGAGASGTQVVRALQYNPYYEVCLVIDDNPKLRTHMLFGIRVVRLERALTLIKAEGIDTVILAKRQTNSATKKRLIQKLAQLSVELKVVPTIDKFLDNSFAVSELPDVSIEDLIGREIVAPLPHLMSKNIDGKVVMVTGAGGSIGSELCRQCLSLQPKKLILFDLSEAAAYQIQQELENSQSKSETELISLIGSVTDNTLVKEAITVHQPHTIFHAAAYKHVPLMEDNPIQAVKNNAIGTLVMAEAALAAKVQNFTLISTDKAVNSTNIMGASKRLAELICHSFCNDISVTDFSIVRFGNVLGSSGSVVPLFQQQIKSGGPITLTHPDIIRYFMTVNEAAALVIQASSLSNGGKTFILDMGEPVKIVDLAFNMARLSGFTPFMEGSPTDQYGDMAIRVTGLRSGEKLFEELSYGKNLIGTVHPRIMMVDEKQLSQQNLRGTLKMVEKCVQIYDEEGLLKIMQTIANYTPGKNSQSKEANNFEKTNVKKIVPLTGR